MDRRTLLVGGSLLVVAGAGAGYAGYRGMASMDEYNASGALTREVLKQAPQTRDLLRYATLAANSHNSQPWLFRLSENRIDILPDFTRRLSAVDPDNHHLFASLGCAAENLAIAAGTSGSPGRLNYDPAQDGFVSLTYGGWVHNDSQLYDAIPKRQSTRGDYDGKPVNAGDLAQLQAAAAIPGVDVVLITDRTEINKVRDLVLSGNTTQMADPAFIRELKAWLRFNPRQALASGDGLFSATSGNPILPSWLGTSAMDLVFTTVSENDKYARQIASSAGIAVFVSALDDAEHWMLAGRSCQRFALQATALGLKHAFINQPVEVPGLQGDLANLVGMAGRRPDIVIRFGYGAALPYSARRSVDALIV